MKIPKKDWHHLEEFFRCTFPGFAIGTACVFSLILHYSDDGVFSYKDIVLLLLSFLSFAFSYLGYRLLKLKTGNASDDKIKALDSKISKLGVVILIICAIGLIVNNL